MFKRKDEILGYHMFERLSILERLLMIIQSQSDSHIFFLSFFSAPVPSHLSKTQVHFYY